MQKEKKCKVRLLALCLAAMLAFSACTSSAGETPAGEVSTSGAASEETAAGEAETAAEGQEVSIKDGTYIGEAEGYHGTITVNAVVEGGAITDIEIEHTETTGIGGVGLEVAKERVLEAQTVNIDNVSGATISTAGFKAALRDILEQAEADPAIFEAETPAPTEKAAQELTVDVVVAGSGVAGEAAALQALEEGAEVLLLEKCSIIGGTTNASGGAIMATMSPLNEEAGDESVEIADWWYERGEEKVNYDQLLFVTQQSGENVKWLMDMGWEAVLGTGGDSVKEWSHRPDDGTGNRLANGGYTVVQTMNSKFTELGGVTMTDTPVTELIINEDGEVTGVIAESKDTVYTITARGGVVLATGGFDNSEEMLHEYAPYGEGTRPAGANAGDTGDAITLALSAGAQIVGPGYTMPSWNSIDGVSNYGADVASLRSAGRAIELNGNMERFVDETVTAEKEKAAMAAEEGHVFYVLIDGNQDPEMLEALDAAVEGGVVFKGESLADIAEQLGTNAENLEATVAHWNEMAENGVDEDFGNPNIQPLQEGTYYMCRIFEGNTGTYGGPQINLDSEVLRPDGTSIPGLYAAGECANGEFYYRDYICGGSSLSMGLAFGRTAGRNAAARAAE